MNELDARFRAWEEFIRASSPRLKRYQDPDDDLVELKIQPNAAQRLWDDKLEERWAQRYVKEEFKRLGFSKIDGPYGRGPDFRVSRKRLWALAEVEIRWQNYRQHGHHLNPAFDRVEYLILLSAEAPSPDMRPKLPPQIIYIDREHFLTWFQSALEPEMRDNRNSMRIAVLAGEMQDYWTTICSDIQREMSTCPNCDACAYFGEGMFGEATPFFRELAAQFIAAHGMTSSSEADLTKCKSEYLQLFVEKHPPY